MSAGEANQPTLSWAQDESNPATEDWAQQSVLAFLLDRDYLFLQS